MSGALQAVFMNQRSFNSFWIGTLGNIAEANVSNFVDSAGNSYVIGKTNASPGDFQFAKYNPSGDIQWQRSLGGAATNEQGFAICTDSSSNVLVAGGNEPNSGNMQIAKYNSSGAIQWQRQLGSANSDAPTSIKTDSSDNIYFVGTSNSFMIIAKYDTSGTIQWQRSLGAATFNSNPQSVAVDSSGNVFVCGFTNAASLGNDLVIAKYNTSGTLQWQRNLGGASFGNERGQSCALDSSSNVYIYGKNGTESIVVKYDTSGTLQWQREILINDTNPRGGIAVSSGGNIFITAYYVVAGYPRAFFTSYNSSGTVQWQRSLSQTANSINPFSIGIDASSNFYFCGRIGISGNENFLMAKLPSDGSLTGTYSVNGQSLVYATATFTDQTSSLTDTASLLTDAASTLTDSATTLTDAATTLTSTVTTI
jgi:hypothetical protein